MNLSYPGRGQSWCALGNHPMGHDRTMVGVGNGRGDGSDGHFACMDCYRQNSGQPITHKDKAMPATEIDGMTRQQIIDRLKKTEDELKLAYANLTSVQTRCTELLEECRIKQQQIVDNE